MTIEILKVEVVWRNIDQIESFFSVAILEKKLQFPDYTND